ncbi:MAG: ferritin [Flavobacteriales bacterium]|nr:ferritin [Flavobacteriales bacterium]
MLKEKIEEALNTQIKIEAESSQIYLAMASWAETQGLGGTAQFLYRHSDEERMHMLKLVQYVNERGGKALIPKLEQPEKEYSNLHNLFQTLLNHEIHVSAEINNLVEICLNEKDYTTHNFMQWYVAEQIEEEALARTIMDKLNMIGQDKGGMYLFDRDIENISVSSSITPAK